MEQRHTRRQYLVFSHSCVCSGGNKESNLSYIYANLKIISSAVLILYFYSTTEKKKIYCMLISENTKWIGRIKMEKFWLFCHETQYVFYTFKYFSGILVCARERKRRKETVQKFCKMRWGIFELRISNISK